jgi:inosine-uridine nucleoside N-ribohydrolase
VSQLEIERAAGNNARPVIPTIWIDTDIALGAARGDVDDGFALAAVAAAARRGKANLLGVSVVSGNTDAVTALRCARACLAAANAESVPVVGPVEAAARLTTLPPGTSLLALGPLTNVASALRRNPGVANDVSLSVVMRVREPWRAPALWLSDLNRKSDPAAADVACAGHWRELRIMPLDVIRRLRLDAKRLRQVAACGPCGAYLREHSLRWLERAHWRYPLRRSFPVWDLVPVLDALQLLHQSSFDRRSRMLTTFDVDAAFDSLLELLKLSDGAAW